MLSTISIHTIVIFENAYLNDCVHKYSDVDVGLRALRWRRARQTGGSAVIDPSAPPLSPLYGNLLKVLRKKDTVLIFYARWIQRKV